MLRKIIFYSLICFIVGDTVYSFLQHLNMPLDGDMAGGIVPSSDVQKILNDPFGISVLTKNQSYPNPNKFFCHKIFYVYFRTIPFLIQKIINPIESIYYTCAIAKIIIQLTITFLLAAYIREGKNFLTKDLIVVLTLVIPFFQINGYEDYMGIIDKSITYTFFYSLPVIFPLIFFLPFYREEFKGERFTESILYRLLLIILIFLIPLSGPLNPGIVLIVAIFILIKKIRESINKGDLKHRNQFKNLVRSLPPHYFYFILPLIIISIYSLYLGSYNTINIKNKISLIDQYINLPIGLYNQFFQKLGFPVLFVALIINWIVIKKSKLENKNEYMKTLKYSLFFIIVYILLLPLGGYREYRPYTVRYDTMIPVTLIFIFMFGYSTFHLLKIKESKLSFLYITFVIVMLFIFQNADTSGFESNDCQQKALNEISKSNKSIVELNEDCTILAWDKIYDPRESELNSRLLHYWGITNDRKLYFQSKR